MKLMSSMSNVGRQLYVDDRSRPEFVRLLKEQGRVSGFEARVYCKDRSVIWISETAREVRDVDGGLLYYEGFRLRCHRAKTRRRGASGK